MLDLQAVVVRQASLDGGHFLDQTGFKGGHEFAHLDIVGGKFLGTTQVKPG